jgi:hypothetical protein
MALTLIDLRWHCCPHTYTLLHYDYLVRAKELKIILYKNLYLFIVLNTLAIDHSYLFFGYLLNISKLKSDLDSC